MSARVAISLTTDEAAQLALLIARLDSQNLLAALSAHEGECALLVEGLSALAVQLTLQGYNPNHIEPVTTHANIAIDALFEAADIRSRMCASDDGGEVLLVWRDTEGDHAEETEEEADAQG